MTENDSLILDFLEPWADGSYPTSIPILTAVFLDGLFSWMSNP